MLTPKVPKRFIPPAARPGRLPIRITPPPSKKIIVASQPAITVASTARAAFVSGTKLHVGCGSRRLSGWVNADAVGGVGDVVLDLHDERALPESTFSVIYGCHVLEHCWPQDTPAILQRLFAALVPGGTLRLSVPDLRLVVHNCLDSHAYGGAASALAVLYGGDFSRTTAAPDLHRQIFWRERLSQLLTDAGFKDVRAWGRGDYPEIDALGDYATRPYGPDGKSLISLNLEADRPKPPAIKEPSSALVVPYQMNDREIDVSVILGTVNRPVMLKECVESVRSSLARSFLTHEIVVAYGAPDDSSLPWMLEQADVVPILGGMDGAIPAFNRAYDASSGRLVCQINDDVLVEGESLSLAAEHLRTHKHCAGVVFKFDRGDGRGYRHEHVGGALHPNQMVVRRETCEAVIEHLGAFWGDVTHRTDKTYGGDTAFGVVCKHLGLQLESVPGVTCVDRLAQDDLRERNAIVAADHGERWRALFEPYMANTASTSAVEWPHLYLPRLGATPRRAPVKAGRPLRLLHLSVQTPLEPQRAQRTALARVGQTVETPWWPPSPFKEREILSMAREHKPDVVFAQVQSAGFSRAFAAQLREVVGANCTLVNWTGDVRTNSQQPVQPWMVELAQDFDIMLSDNTTYALKLKCDEKVPAACGYLGCGVDLEANPFVECAEEDDRLVFLGTNYKSLDAGARERFFVGIERAAPGLVRLYGAGWADTSLQHLARAFVPQDAASMVMRRAVVTLSMSLFSDLGRYSSDRLKRAMASGAVVAVHEFPDMLGLGLRPGENCFTWTTSAELVSRVREWSRPERRSERTRMRAAAAQTARARFSWDRVVEELLAIVRQHRARRAL